MQNNQIEIFKSSDGSPELHVRLVDDSIWLTQSQLVELFDSSKANISEHIQHIFQSGELDQGSTVRNFRTVQKEYALISAYVKYNAKKVRNESCMEVNSLDSIGGGLFESNLLINSISEKI
jgi:hypothetical protein